LRIKRDEYKLAESTGDEVEMNKMKAEFDEIWQTKWPHYNGIDRVPYSPIAKPYPPDEVIKKISARARWQIIATALLARRGVDKRRRFEGLVPKINGAVEKDEFKWAIKEYIKPIRYERPPAYPRGSSEESEEGDWEEYIDPGVRQVTPPANPFPGRQPTYRNRRERPYADMPPEGSPGRLTEGTLPKYSSPDYPLEQGGNKTRKHKRSKHKRSKTYKKYLRKLK
jgi:hypothetical protein